MKPFHDDFPVLEVLRYLRKHENGIEQRKVFHRMTNPKAPQTCLSEAAFNRNMNLLADMKLVQKTGGLFKDVVYSPKLLDYNEVTVKTVSTAIEAYYAALEEE